MYILNNLIPNVLKNYDISILKGGLTLPSSSNSSGINIEDSELFSLELRKS